MPLKRSKQTYFLIFIALLFMLSAGGSLVMLKKSHYLLERNERATGWGLVQLVVLQQSYINLLSQYQLGEDVYEQLLTSYDLNWSAYKTLIEGGTGEALLNNRVVQLKQNFKRFEAEDPLKVTLSGDLLKRVLENNYLYYNDTIKLLNAEFQHFSMQSHERDFSLVNINNLIVFSIFSLCFCGSLFLFLILKDRHRIYYMAYHDSLTQLLNRSALQEKITQLQQHKTPFCILLIDVDGFKGVNDKYGHDIGDELLIQLTKQMSDVCYPPNFIGRLGGDEFAMVCFNPHIIDQFIEHLLAITKNPIMIQNCRCDIGLSIGVSCSRAEHNSWVDVLKDADQAMYRAKAKGGNQHHMHDPD